MPGREKILTLLISRMPGYDMPLKLLTNLDDNSVTIISGHKFLNKGLEIELPNNPDSALIIYKECTRVG